MEVTKLNSLDEKEKVETAKELAERLTKEVEAYKEEVATKTTQEELDTMEKAILTEMNEYDKYLRDTRYTLPDTVVFEGKEYTRQAVAGKIIYFISHIEQTWQYVLGLYELCKVWKSDIKEITYGAMDSTLRLLDQCKFKGMEEWRDILLVNEFMKPMHEQYAKDTTRQIALAQRHNAIIERRDLIEPVQKKDE